MSIIQSIIGTNLTISGGEPPPPPPPSVQGSFIYNGNSVPYGYYGPGLSAPTYETNVNFASTNSTGDQHRLLGDSYVVTSALTGLTTSFYMNLWFYPTANNQVVATIQGTQFENTAYHATLMEINTLSQPIVAFWNQHPSGGGNGALVVGDTVNFNTWNHIYLYNNGTNTVAQLNGGSVFSTAHAWQSNSPGNHFIGFGTQSVTNISASARFAGRIGLFECSSSLMASNYESTKSQYQPSVALAVDAAYNPAYISSEYVLADASASFGYGANGLAIFDQAQDITQGFLFNVGVGWTVENDSGFIATVVSRGDFGYSGAVRIDTPSWSPGPYTFKPPANVWRSTNDTYRYVTLFNTPAYTEGPPAYFSFDPASLEYGSSRNLGNLSRWTVEVWFRVTAGLNGQVAMIVGNQFDMVNRLNFSIGTNSAPSNYNINTGFFDGSWHTAGNLNPTLNTWYHVIGVYDGNYLKQYVNGSLDSQTAYVGTPQSGGEVYVAKRWDTVAGSLDHFPGDIGQATIYAGAMTGDEVSKRWLATKATYGL